MVDLGARGDRPTIRDHAGNLCYRDLASAVDVERDRLTQMGIGAGQRVAVTLRTDRDSILRALATSGLEVTVLPLDASLPGPDRDRQIAGFGADWWIDDSGDVAPGPGGAREEGTAAPAQALCSSGSSGTPKLVLRSREQVEAGVRIHSETLGMDADDRVLAVVSLGHSYGFNSVMLGALWAGAELVLPASGHPRDLLDLVDAAEVTRLAAPPALLDLMVRFQGESRRPLRSLRSCLSVGEALPHATHRAFLETFGVAIWQSYGASEAGPALLEREGRVADEVMALGTPYEGVEVDLLDPSGEPVADHETGEIVIRSPAVGLRYEGDAGGDSRIEAGRFYSGDLGFRSDERFHFGGRKKLLIATGGRKVSPEEVETVLRSHPDVADAAVIGRRRDGRQRLVALIVLRSPRSATELLGFCSERLAAYKVPAEIELRESLPRGPSRKLLRASLV